MTNKETNPHVVWIGFIAEAKPFYLIPTGYPSKETNKKDYLETITT
jgi:hypothetical protein